MEAAITPGIVPATGKPAEPGTVLHSVELAQILEAIQLLAKSLDALQQGFESKIKYDASKERMVDTLHRELQAYHEDLLFKILRPVFLDLISMHDDLGNLFKHADAAEADTESEQNLRRSLLTFRDTIEEILERNGVTIYSEAGQAFVVQHQRAIRTVDTPDPEKDCLVAERIRKGFEYGGRILRPEIVHAFKFKAQPVEAQVFDLHEEE